MALGLTVTLALAADVIVGAFIDLVVDLAVDEIGEFNDEFDVGVMARGRVLGVVAVEEAEDLDDCVCRTHGWCAVVVGAVEAARGFDGSLQDLGCGLVEHEPAHQAAVG